MVDAAVDITRRNVGVENSAPLLKNTLHCLRSLLYDGVGVGEAVLRPDHLGEVLEVDLVDDARLGRHRAEVREVSLLEV